MTDMNINETCHFIYVCPVCFGTYTTGFSLFRLSDRKPYRFRCADSVCGSACAEIKKLNDGKYRISAQCPYCGETHSRTISGSELWTADSASLCCPAFGIKLFLYGGDLDKLSHELEESALDADETAGPDELFIAPGTDPILAEILMIFDRMCSEHSVNCVCGSSDIKFDYENNDTLIICSRCGRKKAFAATKDNLLRLMNASEVIIGG